MNEIESGKDFLLSSAKELRKLKDDIIQLTILRIINSLELSKCTLDDITEELSKKHSFSIDIIFLKELIEDLKKRNYIYSEIGEDAKLCYKVREKAIELLHSAAGYRQQIMDECFEAIINEIPDKNRDEIIKYKDWIVTDFIFAFTGEMDKVCYDIVVNKTTVAYKDYEAILKCNVNGICKELRDKLDEVYTVVPKKYPGLFDSLLNISFFWNSFLRLYSLKPEERKLFVDGIRETQIFADTNTIVSYLCHQRHDHNKTHLSYDFIKKRLGIDIIYSEETRKELEKLMNASKKAVLHKIVWVSLITPLII